MKKIILSLICFVLPSLSLASAPSRPYNYVASTVIDPNQVNSNENTLYTYLQSGVDTYANASITSSAISASAAIPYSKLTLSNSIVNADISASAAIAGSKLDLSSPGTIGGTTAGAGTFTNLTANTDLKSSGTFHLGTTHQGDILYDNGTSIIRLTPGTSGQFLQTQGASANPQWATQNSPGLTLVSHTTVSGAATTGNITITDTDYYIVKAVLGTMSGADTFAIRYNGASTAVYKYVYRGFDLDAVPTAHNGASASDTSINVGIAAKTGCLLTFNIYPSGTFNGTKGEYLSHINATDVESYSDFVGAFAGTKSSFSIITTGGATFSGDVYLYKYSQS